MESLPQVFGPEMANSATARHYHELIEKSVSARRRGDHWAAQKFATEAHKEAMSERTRLQRLAQARHALATATRRLETARAKDPDCTTDEELVEHHPEFKSVITAWQKAHQLVQELEELVPDEATKK